MVNETAGRSRRTPLIMAAVALVLAGAVAGCTDDADAPADVAPASPGSSPAAADTGMSTPDTADTLGSGSTADTAEGAETAETAQPAGTAVTVPPQAIPDLVDAVQPSIVAVITSTGQGSGVVWSADGVIVTNHHVVGDAERVELAFADGRRAPADVEAADPLTDLAVLRAQRSDLPPATFASELPRVGELAIAMGNPLGFENTVTAGIISGLGRALPGAAERAPALIDLIQTDAAISPGNSGGALVNASGEVVGINVAYIPPAVGAESLGFAIPAPTVRDVVEELLEDGQVRHAFFGIQPARVTPQIASEYDLPRERGVLVVDVTPRSPAADARIRPGDILVRSGDRELETVEDFLALLRSRDPGDQVEVTIARGDEEFTAAVVLAERP
jgi:S1-C subfamily serine protease